MKKWLRPVGFGLAMAAAFWACILLVLVLLAHAPRERWLRMRASLLVLNDLGGELDRIQEECGAYPVAPDQSAVLGSDCCTPTPLANLLHWHAARRGVMNFRICDGFGNPIIVRGVGPAAPLGIAPAWCREQYDGAWSADYYLVSLGSDHVEGPIDPYSRETCPTCDFVYSSRAESILPGGEAGPPPTWLDRLCERLCDRIWPAVESSSCPQPKEVFGQGY